MQVPIQDIRIGDRLRAKREQVVAELVESIGHIGLQVPITVTKGVAKREGGGADLSVFNLVAGAHRLEACRRLGWEEIEASVVQMSDNERLLWEIDENLCRAELTELERGEHLAKRKEVYKRLHPEVSGKGANQGPDGQFVHTDAPSFADDVSEKVGISARDIRRSIRRVEKIDAKVRDRIRDLPEIADSGVELDALAAMDDAHQRKAVAMIEAGSVGSIREAKRLIEAPPTPRVAPNFKTDAAEEQREYEAIVKAWNRARQAVRDRFVSEYMDAPVADNTVALRA